MAINKNHEFEELNGIKCAVVEKNATAERVAFLKQLLEVNKYTVVVVPSPPPKVAASPAPKPVAAELTPQPPAAVAAAPEPEPTQPPPLATFTVGVTDVTFNPTNAIFGRSLKTPTGHVVTLAYWHQKERISHDEVPYYESHPGVSHRKG